MSANTNTVSSPAIMPNKRKRSMAPDGKEEREDSPAPQAKKKKKPLQYDVQDLCQELYDNIRNYKAEDGRVVCESFIRVPKRRTAADYYEVVSTPIDLLKIGQKLKTEEYEDIDQLAADVELMINNAKAYYKKTSQEYKDACEILDLFNEVKTDIIAEAFGEASRPERRRSRRADPEEDDTVGEDDDGEDIEKSNGNGDDDDLTEDESLCDQPQDGQPDDPDDLEQLFSSVMTARDGERDMSLIFQLLPSKSKYPEYFEIIKEPVDLKMIAQKIQDGQYKYRRQMERDLMVMIKNAKTFNEPKSQIYKDAVSLKKIIAAKSHELEYKKQGLLKSSERIRTRERTNIQRLSAVCAALKYQSDEDVDAASQSGSHMDYEAESEGDTSVAEDESPLWGLYYAVKNYKTPNGDQLSEPFLKLPSKRFYPDYYEEIKKPISLYNIRKKLKVNQYRNLGELQVDLNLVFDNAKHYNQDTSKLYRDAVVLQKYTAEKKKELDKYDKEVVAAADPTPVTIDLPMVKHEHVEEEHTPKGKGRRSAAGDSEKKKSTKKSPEDGGLKRRMWILYKTVFDYTDGGGRQLRHIFMVLPSRKDYPDYYQVIMEPIDMGMIETKIRNEKYANEQQLLNDFELMFNNARHYNEEGSQVYQDANTLDRALKHKWRYMSSVAPSKSGKASSKPKSKLSSPLIQKLQDLCETIRDYQDKSGRVLSTPFLKLPLKSDYPDYYEVIKRPVDMQRIQQRMESSHNRYDSVEDMVADFVQMFDNACKYNEPDSLIYKDALTLQRICLEKKVELTSDGMNDVPDVRAVVQELMTNLFISCYNYQDEEGRCYSDSFAELVDKDSTSETEEPVEKPPTFDHIKRNLDKGRYRRMDKFQEDMFKVFEYARKVSRTDSQLYEDAVEMQMFFIKIRDELCKNGEMLLTPALSYTERHLQSALEMEKKEKLPLEQKEDEEKKKQQETDEPTEDRAMDQADLSENSVKVKDQVYTVGDFVYVEPRSFACGTFREPELLPHIMLIEKFITDSNGSQMMQGNWFYRPNETFHLATRKFLEKEVFKSDIVTSIMLTQIIGRCHVMFVKEYFKFKPESIPDKDVYVCESRYNARHKAFKKIKIWSAVRNEELKILPRELPMSPVRVSSVFADKASDGKDEDDGETSILDKVRQTVLAEGSSEDGHTYYEQYIIGSGCFKLGDSVYVRSDRDRPLVARIDRIWTSSTGDPFFSGPWFVSPTEIEHSPTRLFYKREVFLSSIEDTNPLRSIIGKCSVLHYKEYCSSRPTEYSEQDVFICESKYHEGEKSIKKLGKGLKKYSLSPKVTDDEIYFFRKAISPQKEPSPLLLKVADELTMEVEDSQDTETDNVPESVNISSEEVSTPQPEKSTKKVGKAKSNVRRQPSGYIVFAGEIRKQIQQENPDCSFGDISRIVGTRWRNLEKEDKERFEEKAKKIAEEQAAKQQEAERAFNESLNRSQSPWNDFGRVSPGSSARPATPGSFQQGYPQGYQGFPQQPGMQYGMQNGPMTPQQGMLYNVTRAPPPNGMPMPQGQRGYMPPYQQHPSRPQGPYMTYPQGQTPPPGTQSPIPNMNPLAPMSPGSYPMMPHSPSGGMLPGQMQQQMVPPPPPPRPPSPVFVSVPPRTQRLLHSEAYLRYIEGLNTESKTIGDWDKTLSATPETTPAVPESRLPTQWLAQGAGYHGNVTNALWALRDFMLKDTLNIARTIPFEDL
ncbi:protein polybromo-1-like isoform X2 [Haliotis rufescens]|uniref:protein polybromo-1-like isoform X2 n=1 Tax=Haliotis rufescens TaxID=6454 RepID=UPI001EB05281|nr:protein polybromo-1-like isoform X2 [Haliotis rufescens]